MMKITDLVLRPLCVLVFLVKIEAFDSEVFVKLAGVSEASVNCLVPRALPFVMVISTGERRVVNEKDKAESSDKQALDVSSAEAKLVSGQMREVGEDPVHRYKRKSLGPYPFCENTTHI